MTLQNDPGRCACNDFRHLYSFHYAAAVLCDSRNLCRYVEGHSHFSPRFPSPNSALQAQKSTMSAPVASPQQESPLLAAGLVKNSLTGRLIKIDGGTYHNLLEKGFTLDRESGAMLPPPSSPDLMGQDVVSPALTGSRRPSRQSTRRRGPAGTPMQGSGNSSMTSPY
jgi:hypothetical protein